MGIQILIYTIIIILAIWKFHDLWFHFGELKHAKNLNQKLIQFFAEHTYKVVNDSKTYEPAPDEIYNWLTDSYIEWQDEQVKNKEETKWDY